MADMEIYQDGSGGYRFRLKSGNGETVIPPESHTKHTDAERAFRDMVGTVLEYVRETHFPATPETRLEE